LVGAELLSDAPDFDCSGTRVAGMVAGIFPTCAVSKSVSSCDWTTSAAR
jgi:hypothetical protein